MKNTKEISSIIVASLCSLIPFGICGYFWIWLMSIVPGGEFALLIQVVITFLSISFLLAVSIWGGMLVFSLVVVLIAYILGL